MRKRKVFTVLVVLLMIVGFGVLCYPTISDQWNTYRQSLLISDYTSAVESMDEEDFEEEWAKAESFNDTLVYNDIYADVFGEDSSDEDSEDADGETDADGTDGSDASLSEDEQTSEYWNVLNVSGDGVMGYISIPKINQEIPIYHGTSEEILQTGAGHLNGTKLPIGGESTHSVIAAHRGLPSAKLFTDIDQLEVGDMFYLHILDEVLAYQVDTIYPMVEKDDTETLSEALAIIPGEDHVSLFTCTPYGVNSHRLIVRGTRVPYTGEDEAPTTFSDTMLKSIQNYYMLYTLMGLAIAALLLLIIKAIAWRKGGKKTAEPAAGGGTAQDATKAGAGKGIGYGSDKE